MKDHMKPIVNKIVREDIFTTPYIQVWYIWCSILFFERQIFEFERFLFFEEFGKIEKDICHSTYR